MGVLRLQAGELYSPLHIGLFSPPFCLVNRLQYTFVTHQSKDVAGVLTNFSLNAARIAVGHICVRCKMHVDASRMEEAFIAASRGADPTLNSIIFSYTDIFFIQTFLN